METISNGMSSLRIVRVTTEQDQPLPDVVLRLYRKWACGSPPLWQGGSERKEQFKLPCKGRR